MPKIWNMARTGWPREAVRIDRASKWGNPFAVGRDGARHEVIAKFEAWLQTQPQLLEALPELRGKDLACWCAPEPCHGDVLIRLANERPPRTFWLAVIGSRSFQDAKLAERVLDAVVLRIARVHGDDVDLRIVSGGARGADTLGERYAQANGIPCEVIRPDYAAFGDAAPTQRNHTIVLQAHAVVAFWNGRRGGTYHALGIARRLARPTLVVRVDTPDAQD